MAARKRRIHGAAFKGRVALAACRGDKTLAELAGSFGVHTHQITTWKQRLLEGVPELFEDRRRRRDEEDDIPKDKLYEQIGRLQIEVEWLKKKAAQLGS